MPPQAGEADVVAWNKGRSWRGLDLKYIEHGYRDAEKNPNTNPEEMAGIGSFHAAKSHLNRANMRLGPLLHRPTCSRWGF